MIFFYNTADYEAIKTIFYLPKEMLMNAIHTFPLRRLYFYENPIKMVYNINSLM